ncbi:MAG: ATP-binding cassette domain-containing protein [Alphaproteobacteria bacterium]|nr:ATP-binding cassette domain-containing protein [Alphaproteobacteria bacterium]
MSEATAVVDPVTGQPAAIRYADVHKAFGDHAVLCGLDLVIPRGRITFIIGRSGTGKSVTLKHVMGLLKPDKGRIWVGDDELGKLNDRHLRKVRERFGFVFQHAALFDSMTVRENIAFPLVEHTRMRRREIDARVTELLAQVGLRDAGDKIPSELSGGMRKRVGLARALVRDPEFLLYDEPTTGLDPVLAAAMDQLIADTQKRRPDLTSVVISHDMAAVFRIADKVAFLVDGKVRYEATPDRFKQIEDPLVQQFVTGSLEGPMQV